MCCTWVSAYLILYAAWFCGRKCGDGVLVHSCAKGVTEKMVRHVI